jgi:molecular chaperone DnaJ
VDPGPLTWTGALDPFLPILYVLVGLIAAYFAFRAAGYGALALVFLAVLVVGGQGEPKGLLQFGTLGIVILLAAIWLGNRRARAARG